MKEILEFLNKYAGGLNLLWTVIAGLATASLFLLKPLYRYIFRDRNKQKDSSSTTTVVVQSFDRDYFRDMIKEEIRKERSDFAVTGDANQYENDSQTNEIQLFSAIEHLSRLRKKLKPDDLSRNVFPHDLDVIEFNPSGKFKIRSRMSTGNRIFVALFCLPHYLIFPGFFGFPVFDSYIFGAIVGVGLWVWRNRLGAYVSIDIPKKKHALIMPAAASWMKRVPEIEVKSHYNNNIWKTDLLIGGETVIERETAKEQRHEDLDKFVKALKWSLGSSIEIADGVYITP
jgi:hypothetical protein